MKCERVVNDAKARLEEAPYDAGHDLGHHERVVGNCLWIVEQEGLENKVDEDVLLLAAWWHDVERGSETHELMQVSLRNAGASEEFVSRVLSVVGQHSYGNSQEGLEAWVLYDADKLDYVAVPRVERVFGAVDSGGVEPERLRKYGRVLGERLPGVPGSLHFESVRQRFERDLKELMEFLGEKGFEW